MIFFKDSFTGINGTHLAAHTPDVGGPWVDDTPGWQIQANKAKATVDNCASHVEIALPKIWQLAAVINFGGQAAPAAGVELIIGDDASANYLDCLITDEDVNVSANLVAGTAADGDSFPVVSGLPGITNPFVFQVNFGPDLCTVMIDGVTVARFPRSFDKTFKATRLTMKLHGVVPAIAPVIQSLVISI